MLPPFIKANSRTEFLSQSHLSVAWPWYLASGISLVAFLPGLYLYGWLLPGIALFIFPSLVPPTLRSATRIPRQAILLLITGAILGTLVGQSTLNNRLPGHIIKQDVEAIGRIEGPIKQGEHHQRFKFNITQVQHQGDPVQYHGPVMLNCYRPCPDFQSGQRWRMTLRLKPAHGSLNPGGFNYAQWLFSQRIRSSGYVRTGQAIEFLDAPGLSRQINPLRAYIHRFIRSQSLQHGGILSALAVGIRDDIDEARWRVLRHTGTAHLVAISGLHIGMVAAIAYFFTHFAWRHSLLQRSQLPAPTVARIGALIAATFYAALAGFALPTLRALLMLLSYFLLLSLRRNPGIFFSLGLILAVVLTFDPLATLNSGLWLSFTAVAMIAVAATGKRHAPETDATLSPKAIYLERVARWFKQWWRIQTAIFIGLAPLSLLFFQQLSLVSMPANFIAIPLMALLVVPLTLLSLIFLIVGLPFIASALLTAADTLLNLLWPLLLKLSELPISIYSAAAPTGWQLVIGSICAIIFISPRSGWRRLLAIPGLIWLLFSPAKTIPHSAFKVQLLDVGQGLAVLVQTQQHSLLYDAGVRYSGGFDSGRASIIPFLKQQHIKQLDTVVVSHNNLDHYGGMASTLEAYPANERYASAAFYASSEACEAGQNWKWDGVEFSFLHPLSGNKDDDNNGSCVLKIKSHYGSILLSGDIEQQAESALLQNARTEIEAIDVLLAPHHGSKTSSTAAFIDVLKPRLILISAGYLNRFSHPHPDIMTRYNKRNIPSLNTAESGWISLMFDEKGIHAQPWREVYRRYWLEAVTDRVSSSIQLLPRPEPEPGDKQQLASTRGKTD